MLIWVADSQCSARTESRVQTNLTELLQMITWANIPELQPQTCCALWQRLWASRMDLESALGSIFLVTMHDFFYCMEGIVKVYLRYCDLCRLTMIFNEILWVQYNLISTDSICNVDYLKNNLDQSNNNNGTPKTQNDFKNGKNNLHFNRRIHVSAFIK